MSPYYQDDAITLYHGHALDVLKTLPDQTVNCCVTSPPYYGLRDYGEPGQYGLEKTPAEYVANMRTLFAEVRRVLADDGTLWLNLGDSYSTGPTRSLGRKDKGRDFGSGTTGTGAGGSPGRQGSILLADALPAKNLLGIPWRTAFALQDDGWLLRNAIVWNKPNAMPESVTDRLSTRYELLFVFSKSRRYWFDLDAIRDDYADAEDFRAGRPQGEKWRDAVALSDSSGLAGIRPPRNPAAGRNPGDVWEIATVPYPGAHFATFPPELPRRCIQAGCKPAGTVLDPFSGTGCTGMVAGQLGRRYIGVDINRKYLDDSLKTRLAQTVALDEEPA